MTERIRTGGIPPVDEQLRLGAFTVRWNTTGPAALSVTDVSAFGRPGAPLVEVFTSVEQRARTSQAYHRSAVGSRLRVQHVETALVDGRTALVVVQKDPVTALQVRSVLTEFADAVRLEHEFHNDGPAQIVLTAVSSASIGFGQSAADLERLMLSTAESEWLAENRWRDVPVRSVLPELSLGIHEQDGRGHHALTSHGTWSTGEHLPVGVLHDPSSGAAIAWQVETSAGWHIDLCQGADGGTLTLLGPTDLEHQFAHRLEQGESFHAVPAAIACSDLGRDGALGALTRYRRGLRRDMDDQALPIVYNDFMNTLMGAPTSEALRPLVSAAAEAGAEIFCIDAGWFADPALGDWWSTVGEWQEAASRFDASGLKGLIEAIHGRGMRSGLWLEPEVVGVDSATATSLPEDAFFRRFGTRVQEHGRFHLDFRHPAARAHLDETVDRLVRDYGISYLKLDYNINPGAGTEWRSAAAGDGLLGHARAFRDWLVDLQRRHPQLMIENCSSGAMRADYSLLGVTHLQSTSDQQDFRRYPPIAASAPASILPEQSGNWAYPSVEMTDEETAFTLVTGLSGRLYISGFLDRLRSSQTALVAEAVALHRDVRASMATGIPFWPLGMPDWDAETIVLGLSIDGGDLLFVWDRSEHARSFHIPGVATDAEQVFPVSATPWAITGDSVGLTVTTPQGFSARVLRVTTSRNERPIEEEKK